MIRRDKVIAVEGVKESGGEDSGGERFMKDVEIGSIDFRVRVGDMGMKLGQLNGLASCVLCRRHRRGHRYTIRPETERQQSHREPTRWVPRVGNRVRPLTRRLGGIHQSSNQSL